MGDGVSVKVIFQDKYTLSGDDEPQLKEILGNHFDELIEEKFSVTLKPEVLAEGSILGDELERLLGDRVGEFLDTVVSLKIKPDFKKNIYRAVNPQGLNNLRTFVKQFKPSMK